MTKARKKPGRKPKPKDMKRSVKRQLCFTAKEWDVIEAAAAAVGREPGVYARQAVIEKAIGASEE